MRAESNWVAALCLALPIACAQGQDYTMAWHTIDGGGGASAGGTYSIVGTIGQADTTVLAGGVNTLDAGFWPGISIDAGCNPADLVVPFGVLDFFDVVAFLGAFSAMEPEGDLAVPEGVWDFFDVVQFLGYFDAGCP